MKISAIGSYLSQTEAATLWHLADKVMALAEANLSKTSPGLGITKREADASDAQGAAYALRCVAEQSILENDGMLNDHLKKTKVILEKDGLVDFDAVVVVAGK